MSGEVLEARDMARMAYDAAKSAARIMKAKQAHDSLIADVHRSQAHALAIRARAEMRLAEEYDAAQERGEVRGANERTASRPEAVGADEIGLSHKDIHDARAIRDAERADPGITQRTLDGMIERGEEPTSAVSYNYSKFSPPRVRWRALTIYLRNFRRYSTSPRAMASLWEASGRARADVLIHGVVNTLVAAVRLP